MGLTNITVPDLGGTAEVDVIEVLVKPGDKVKENATLVTLESDKATMEVPSTTAGVVKEVKVKVGDKVSSGTVILTLEAAAAGQEKTEAAPVAPKATSAPEAPASTQMHTQTKTQSADVAVATPSAEGDAHAGPGVRQLARELGVDLSTVMGSGPKQRILKEDVQAFVKSQLAQLQTGTLTAAPLPMFDFSQYGAIEAKPLTRIKKLTGKNLSRNWTMIPHVTQFGEADITGLEEFRVAHKAEFEKKNVKLTPLVFIMKAVVSSLHAFPQFNASLDSRGENLILKKYFHIGVAVDTPEGLVVPVIRDVDKKGLVELAKELSVLSEKARNKQLMPSDMQGGCFSISSLGGIGGTAFTPIINYPEVAILGVSKASMKPVFMEGEFVPRLMLPLSLSYDHRVIDGADGARFIMHVSQMLSDIRNLLL